MTIVLRRPGPCVVCGTLDAMIPFVDLSSNDGSARTLCCQAFGVDGCNGRAAAQRLRDLRRAPAVPA